MSRTYQDILNECKVPIQHNEYSNEALKYVGFWKDVKSVDNSPFDALFAENNFNKYPIEN
jgi:hypothetical protein